MFHFIIFVPLAALFTSFVLFQITSRGLSEGLLIVLIAWSGYVLTVPVAHGRIVIGMINKIIGGKQIFPERYVWMTAAALQTWLFLMYRDLYFKAIFTYLFYRVFTVPQFFIIPVIAALAAWFRTMVWRFVAQEYRYGIAIVRYTIMAIGFVVLFVLLRCDLVVILNSLATG